MDGDYVDENWEITLNDATFSNDQGLDETSDFYGTTTTDTSGVNPGVWRGEFYGVPGR